MKEEPHVYTALDRPDVEVLWADEQGIEHWCPGEARMRLRLDGGTVAYSVQYRRPGATSSHIDTFPADRVRLDTVDRSAGRG